MIELISTSQLAPFALFSSPFASTAVRKSLKSLWLINLLLSNGLVFPTSRESRSIRYLDLELFLILLPIYNAFLREFYPFIDLGLFKPFSCHIVRKIDKNRRHCLFPLYAFLLRQGIYLSTTLLKILHGFHINPIPDTCLLLSPFRGDFIEDFLDVCRETVPSVLVHRHIKGKHASNR